MAQNQRFTPNPNTSAYSSYRPGQGQNPVAAQGQQVRQGMRPAVNNQQTTVSTNTDMLKLVSSLAQQKALTQGNARLKYGRQIMRDRKPMSGDVSWRNLLAGSIQAQMGRGDIDEAIEMEREQMMRAQEAQRQGSRQEYFQEQEARGQAAEILAQAHPTWPREMILATAAEVAAGRIPLKDAMEFNPEGEEKGPTIKTRTVANLDGTETTEEYIEGEGGSWTSKQADKPDEPDSPFSAAEMANARKQNRGLTTADESVDALLTHIEEKGRAILPGTVERADAQAMSAAVLAALKDAYDLGALQGPDLELLEPLIPDLSKGWRAETAKTSLNRLKKDLAGRRALLVGQYGEDVLKPPIETRTIRYDAEGNRVDD